jgi:class 3 adenylate cyclase/tetratricopeptide (TPR) repeat protein
MQCAQCGTANRDERSFCAECGAPLPLLCAGCGFENESGEKFCGGCGAAIDTGSASQPTPAASRRPESAQASERRQLTVMFCDMVGSTALAYSLDPEDLRTVMRDYQRICAGVIEQWGGSIERYVGDGILAYFSYPIAHEDDPERAVRAGLEIIDSIEPLRIETDGGDSVRPSVRVGISTGVVVAGDVVGRGAARETLAIGETPNIAARLQGLAEPNTVVIGPVTRGLLNGLFEFESLGEVELKGVPEPTPTWRVTAARATESRFEAQRAGGLTPFVGRDEELKTLDRLWSSAEDGKGQVLVLRGDAGIGKSRIVDVFRQRVAARKHEELRLQCSPQGINSPLHPVIHRLTLAAGFQRADDAATRLDKLESLLAVTDEAGQETVPLFASLLSVPLADGAETLRLSPQQQKDRTLTALLEQVDRLQTRRPVLVVLEDAHWLDPTSRELLDLLVARAPGQRVLLLVTTRPGFEPAWDAAETIELKRLRIDECQAFLTEVAGAALPEEVTDLILDKADGVPLFLEELTRGVLRTDLVARESDGYVLRGPVAPLAIPSTLHDSLTGRLDTLGAAKELAQTGAVIGREFTRELLAAVADRDEEALGHDLDELLDSQILLEQPDSAEPAYIFRHALLQAASYEGLLKSRRQALHSRVAQVIEERLPEYVDASPELLAHHYVEAEQWAPAVGYLARAGKRALGRSANFEAIAHLERGLKVIARLPESRERMRQELGLLIMLGGAYRAPGGFSAPEVDACFRKASLLCERLGDEAVVQRVDVLRGLYAGYYSGGELAKARELAEQVLELAQTHSESLLVVGEYMLGAMMFWQGDFDEAYEHLDRSLSLYDPAKVFTQNLAAQIDPGCSAMYHLTWTLWVLGYPDQARAMSEETVRTARKLHQPFTLGMVLFWAGATALCSGDWEGARRYALELESVTTDHALRYLSGSAKVLLSHVHVSLGEIKQGLSELAVAQQTFESQNAGLGRPFALAAALAAMARVGKADEGLALAEQAFVAVDGGERHWEAELYRLRGELLRVHADDRSTEAEAAFREALRVAAAQGARSLELRAATSLAALLRDRGRVDEAKAGLATVYEWFTEGFDTADLRAAGRMLKALS